MKRSMIEELNKLNGKKTKYGKLKVEYKDDICNIFAYITVDERKVAWFKSGVISGTYDASDDCRDIPYTDAYVKFRVYPPNPKSSVGHWDAPEREWYHNDGWTEYCNSNEKLPQFFNKLAEMLASWF